jgi:hypothetical protein
LIVMVFLKPFLTTFGARHTLVLDTCSVIYVGNQCE